MSTRTEAQLTQGEVTVSIGTRGGAKDKTVPGYGHNVLSAQAVKDLNDVEAGAWCYISAIPGQKFCVHVTSGHPGRHPKYKDAGLRVNVSIDLVLVASVFWPPENLEKGEHEFELTDCEVVGGKCDFVFGDRKSTESDLSEDQGINDRDWIGTIVVQPCWCNYDILDDPELLEEQEVDDLLEQMYIAEKLGTPVDERMKGVEFDIGIEYNPRKKRPSPKKTAYSIHDPLEKGFAYVFRYWRPALLVAEGIAPRGLLRHGKNKAQSTRMKKPKPILKPRSRPGTRLWTRTKIKRETSSPVRGTCLPSQRREAETKSPKVERRASKRLASRKAVVKN
ncbi:hypothetical protein FRC09_018028 [Ceratobasidium sp. 395]|nr:hypothetical protein FRC09_018028 [Ceratobasidium sp. 395]